MFEIETISRADWRALSVPDVYFSQAYHHLSEAAEPDVEGSVLLRWRDNGGEVYLPLIIRRVPGTPFRDATSAYGYGGPWELGSPHMRNFAISFSEWASQHRLITTFLRYHPQVDNGARAVGALPVQSVGTTVEWNLEGSKDLLAGLSKSHRRSIRLARQAGVEVQLTRSAERLNHFRTLYNASMNRLSATGYYVFNDVYWERLHDLAEPLGLLQVDAILDDTSIASVLALTQAPRLHFHLSGTTDEARRVGAAHLTRLAAAEWAQASGFSRAHFGGGFGGADSSLLSWKQRFDPASAPLRFEISKIVHDWDAYTELCGTTSTEGYFPPWRSS